MIGSVTQIQQEALAAEKARRAQAGLIGRVVPEGDGGESAAAAARGFEDGPGEPVMPGHPEPEDFRRGYIDAGHGAESPMAEPPRHNPMPRAPARHRHARRTAGRADGGKDPAAHRRHVLARQPERTIGRRTDR